MGCVNRKIKCRLIAATPYPILTGNIPFADVLMLVQPFNDSFYTLGRHEVKKGSPPMRSLNAAIQNYNTYARFAIVLN